MKKLIVFLLVLGLCLPAFAGWSYTRTGKTLLANSNYLIWGTFTDADTGGGTVLTKLSTIRAFGFNISDRANLASPLQTSVSAGIITVTSVANGPDGYWWAIGR